VTRAPSAAAPRRTTRRAFIARSCGATLALGLGACGGVTALPVTPRDGLVRIDLRDHPGLIGPGGWLKLAPAGLPHPVYVLSLGDGAHAALSPICTHQGCTVDIAGRQLVCPCHGSVYERTGVVVRGPAERALTRFETRRDGDALVIRIP
jgi:nitrite reductase/ring-hydroxylating ferredoxin subunit